MKRRERMPLKKRVALTARGYRMLGGVPASCAIRRSAH